MYYKYRIFKSVPEVLSALGSVSASWSVRSWRFDCICHDTVHEDTCIHESSIKVVGSC